MKREGVVYKHRRGQKGIYKPTREGNQISCGNGRIRKKCTAKLESKNSEEDWLGRDTTLRIKENG